MTICEVPTCAREAKSAGYCHGHYSRLRKSGDLMPDVPLRKRAPNGAAAKWISDHAAHEGEECLIWPFHMNNKGYAAIVYNGRSTSAARVMCIEVYGPPAGPDIEAAHSCGNGHLGCVHPGHLRWATKKENGEDKSMHGRSLRGEKSSQAKITREEVRGIKAALAENRMQKKIAEEFGVSQQLVSAINRGHCWSWLDTAVDGDLFGEEAA